MTVEAVALYDYIAQEADELSFKKGDLITKIKDREGGWCEGTSKDGKRGLFPDTFVEVISKNTIHGKIYRAKYSYIPVNIDELELKVGEIVEFISEVEEGWWEGRLKDKIGVFPSNFVEESKEIDMTQEENNRKETEADEKMDVDELKTTDNVAPVLPPKPISVKEMCIALFPYEAKHDDELTLKENDLITLLSTDLPDKGWWKGQLNGKIGVFPDNFVKLIPLGEDVCKPKRPSVSKTSTNRARDAINKQTTNSSSGVAALRKSLEAPTVSKSPVEENKKPLVSKKPDLQTPSSTETTKLQFSVSARGEKLSSSADSSLNISAKSSGSEFSPLSLSKSFENDGNKSWSETNVDSRKVKPMSVLIADKLPAELSPIAVVEEKADNVDGLSCSKVYTINNCYEKHTPNNLNSKSTDVEKDVDLNAVERTESLSHPTAARAKAPKRRPPSGTNFKEDEITEIPITINNTKVTINGVSKGKPAPWLEELKKNQNKKNSSQVNIRGGFTSVGSNVTFRFQRPVSMFTGDAEAQSLSLQSQSLPQCETTSSTINVSSTPPILCSPEKVVTVSASHWNSLIEKVNVLEMRLEKQNVFFTKAIEQLRTRLDHETTSRVDMKNEIEKLMELVTQV